MENLLLLDRFLGGFQTVDFKAGYPSSFDITVLIFQNYSFAILTN